MRIAVDASALEPGGAGIGRYLRQILTHALASPDATHEWRLYRRVRSGEFGARAVELGDGLPADLGRIAALFTTLPWQARRDRPDVFWGPAHRLPLALPDALPSVVTIHDLCWRVAPDTMRRSTRWLDRHLMPGALRRADRIIAVSEATASDLRTWDPALAPKLRVIPEAAAALPSPLPASWLERRGVRAPYFLFAGTIEPRKNLDRLLQAFARLPETMRTRTQLVIAGGDGWGAAPISGEQVLRLGRVDDAELATLYAHAHCLVMPSLYEGFGLPLLEAMSLGTPVVTANNSSMPEVAGGAALLVDALDVDDIARALGAMLAEPGLRDRLAAAAKHQAARYSWQRAANETLRVLEEARVEGGAARRRSR